MSATPSFIIGMINPDGVIEAGMLSAVLRVSKAELALASGLSRDAISETAQLRDIAWIVQRTLPWYGSLLQAFGGRTSSIRPLSNCGAPRTCCRQPSRAKVT